MSRTKKFLYNSLSTGLYQVILMIVGFITPRVMLKCYGSEINGLVSSITQFITYFNLVEAGISGAGVYALYKPLAEKNYDEINRIVSAVKKFYYQSGYIFTGLVGGLAVVYPIFIKAERLSPIYVCLLVLFLGAKGFLEFFTLAKYRVLLTADQKTYVISIASSIYIVLNMIIIVVLSYLKANVVLVYALAIISLFVRSAILIIYVKKRYKNIRYDAEPNENALDKRWSALFLQILSSIQIGAPVVIATILTSINTPCKFTLQTVSVYSIYNMVMLGINGVLSIFVSGLAASFGDVIVRKETETLQKAYKDFEFTYYSLITAVYSIAFILIVPFINIYTSDVNDTNYNLPFLGFLFVLNGLLYNMKTPQGMLVISAGLYKETIVQTSIQGGIIVVFGAFLGYFWGLEGIMIAACLSNLYRVIDLMIFIPKNVTKLPIKVTSFRYLRLIGTAALIYMPFYFKGTEIYCISHWLFYAIVTGIYAVLVLYMVGRIFEPDQVKMVSTRIKGMVKKVSG